MNENNCSGRKRSGEDNNKISTTGGKPDTIRGGGGRKWWHAGKSKRDKKISHNNISYSDDNDGQVTADKNATDPIGNVFKKASESAKMWGRIIRLTGGDIALHKCSWQMIAWELRNGMLELVAGTDKRLIMEDGRGAFAVIEFLSPDEPNVGLGYRLCPSGNQAPQFEHTLNAIEKMCKAVSSASLIEREARQVLEQRLIPKLTYPFHLTSFGKKECKTINSVIRKTFLPAMRLNQHLPTAVA